MGLTLDPTNLIIDLKFSCMKILKKKKMYTKCKCIIIFYIVHK